MGKHVIEIDEVEFVQLKRDLYEKILDSVRDTVYPIVTTSRVVVDAGDMTLDTGDFEADLKKIIDETVTF